MKYIVFNKKTGKKLNKTFDTITQAIAEAKRQNIITNNYNFLVTNIK